MLLKLLCLVAFSDCWYCCDCSRMNLQSFFFLSPFLRCWPNWKLTREMRLKTLSSASVEITFWHEFLFLSYPLVYCKIWWLVHILFTFYFINAHQHYRKSHIYSFNAIHLNILRFSLVARFYCSIKAYIFQPKDIELEL